MSAEKPARGGEWLGNAGVYERQRAEAAETAERYREEARDSDAAWWEERARRWREARDHEQRREEDRRSNARIFRRRYGGAPDETL